MVFHKFFHFNINIFDGGKCDISSYLCKHLFHYIKAYN